MGGYVISLTLTQLLLVNFSSLAIALPVHLIAAVINLYFQPLNFKFLLIIYDDGMDFGWMEVVSIVLQSVVAARSNIR